MTAAQWAWFWFGMSLVNLGLYAVAACAVDDTKQRLRRALAKAGTARRDAIADAVDQLRNEAREHHGAPGDAIRRHALFAAAERLDASIGRHAQRRGEAA